MSEVRETYGFGAQSMRERSVILVVPDIGAWPVGVYWSWLDSLTVAAAAIGGAAVPFVLLTLLEKVLKS